MVTMKRKTTTEKDRYGGFNSVIEIGEVKNKSYNTNQREGLNYTKREAFVKKGETMPKIESESKKKSATVSETLSTKTKVLLIVYLATAIVLSAIVIGTGIAIANASNRVDGLQLQIQSQNEILLNQEQTLYVLNDENAITGSAVNNLGMEKYDADSVIEIPLIPLSEPTTYTVQTNWFDQLCRFFSSIFA